MRVCALVMALCLCAIGCRSAPPPPATPEPKPVALDPDTKLYEMLREGAFRMNAASEGLEQALNASLLQLKKEKSGTVRFQHLDEIVSLVDEAGLLVSDHTAAPPPIETVKAQFAKFDDKRLKAIADGNGALKRLMLAIKHANGLGDSKEVGELADLIGLAQDELEGSITAYGGVVEAEAPEPKAGG